MLDQCGQFLEQRSDSRGCFSSTLGPLAASQAEEPLTLGQRIVGDLGLIACWLALWGISVALGMELGNRVMNPKGNDPGYSMLVVFVGFTFISPVGFACSTFFLWIKRNVRLFIATAGNTRIAPDTVDPRGPTGK